ncbi:amino acid adenylation domain-containing protein [Allocatelliglobosispora scoriae]|uniref:Amino acid adenylation domain-containing protein n=1 Tax=Allocatelliglobosispora scoriae TaxID=643052 RepID=A0A841BLN1_9ACTN|nr:non-ribosomal peptide synthetase/MFS transporter [Allocatelliglobosispora scoriae]MBB5867883.1 amino acid adenylation domain-containing protein [Allocatelliglobosispora scoriae]
MTEPSVARRLAELTPQQRAQLTKLMRERVAKPRSAAAIPVIDRSSGRLPISNAARRLYFLQKLRPESAAYNNVEAIRLRGELDADALSAALVAVVARHEVLRTTVGTADGDGTPELVVAQLRPHIETLPSSSDALAGMLAAAANRPFDLDVELPLRVVLLRLGDDEHVLLFTIHHIASDAWSCRLLVREFFEAYAAAAAGAVPDATPPAVQYADFAAWQAAARGSDRHLSYWRERLAGLAPVLELPLEQARPALRSDHAAEIHLDLDRGLHQAARDASVTPFALLLTAFGHVLHRHCSTEDVAVAIPVSGRDRVDVEQLIGCFINTVVLRLDLSELPTRRQLVRRVWEQTLADLEHQELPFEQLVAELVTERDLAAGQLVQVMFNYYPATEPPSDVVGLRLDPVEVPHSRAKFDLACTVVDHGDRLRMTLNYATDLLGHDTVCRMGEHLVAVLAGLLADLDAPVATLPPVPPGDPLRPARVPAGIGADPVPVLRRFEQQARAHPDRVAVRGPGESVTYRDLDERAGRLAGHLAEQAPDGGVVGLLFERSADYVTAMIAAMKAGLTYVPLDPVMPVAHLAAVQRAAGAHLLLTHAAVTVAPVPGVRTLAIEDIEDRPSGNPPTRVLAVDDAMYVLFTSGSTGTPKGVVVEHRHFASYLDSIVGRMALPDGLHYALVSTFAADLGLTNVYGALATGGTLHLLPYEWAADPQRFADYFGRHRIDVMKLVPSHLQAVADAGLLAAVVPARHLVLAGEACPWDLVTAVRAAREGCAVWNQYGPTETTVSVLAYPVPQEVPAVRGATVPLGYPLDHVGVHVVDRHLRPVPRGAAGELLITGDSVARGYLGAGGADHARFIEDPFSAEPGARAYRSGDRVRERRDGSIEFLGRLDRQVKIRGYRVEPAHVESVLRRHPAIADAAVAVRTDNGRAALVAYYVPRPGVPVELSPYDFARGAMPAYLVPSAFVALDRLPLTPNGKLDWRALPEPDRHAARDRPATPPRNAREAHLAELWCEVLGLDEVHVDDDFFAVGGDSFAAMRLARRIGASTRVVSIFQYPTIRQFAEAVGGATSTGYLCRLPGAGPEPVAATATVIAVPFGGATAVAYAELARALPPEFPLYAVELPGHDSADPEQALRPFEEIAAGCVEEVRRTVAGPIVVYGHCVGAALAYDIARRLELLGMPVVGVVLGGAFPAPRLPGRVFDVWARLMPSDRWRSDRLYRDMLRGIGGLTEIVDPHQQAFTLRAVRHDARESEELYTRLCHSGQPTRSLHALSVVGDRDRITEFHSERHAEWNLLCARTDLAVIPDAGHFFLKHQAGQLADIVVGWTGERLSGPAADPAAVGESRPATAPEPARRIAAPAAPAGNLRGFALVTLGQLVSLTGSRATAFALGIWVYLQTGSVTRFSSILIVALLPGLLLLPLAGAAADRWNRRALMIGSEVANAVGTGLCLVAFATGSLQLWHVYTAAALGSVASSFQQPAYMAAVAQLIPKQYLGRTNGVLQAVMAVSQAAGPLLGGALIVSIGLGGVMVADLATVLVALVTLLAVRFPDLLFRRREETLWKEIVGGLRYIARRRPLVAMVVFFLGYNLILGLALALLPPMVLAFGDAGTLSLATMIGAVGGIAGGMAMALWGGFDRRTTGMIGFVALTGVGLIVSGLRPSAAFPIVGIALMMASIALINGHWQTMIQIKVGMELQGRILATNRMTANLTEPLGYLVAGWLADAVVEPAMAEHGRLATSMGGLLGTGPGRGMALALVVLGTLHVLLAVVGLRWSTLRRMEDALPDAVPGAVVTWDRDELQREADRRV